MHRFKAPDCPNGFSEAVKEAIAAVNKDVAANRAPSYEPTLWRGVAAAVAAATHSKCAFCEIMASAGMDADVEHFYPKNEVASLSDDPEDWGEEVSESLARIKGRRLVQLSTRGYYWRAYDFANYLFSCHLCNRKYKLTIFPVLEGKARKLPPEESAKETPLLLNPFVGPHPIEHLAFDELGAIAPYKGSMYGHETIKTCGLNRNKLRGSREEKAWDVHEAIKSFLAEPSEDEQRGILKRIHRWGDERFVHCGMVRAVFTQCVGMSWTELERRLGFA